jgi:3,4-dihydroxy-9,10-secoandrosta-1,3,5(10)-triene-9,17-dione 4,5-dioxygenase
MDIRGLGYIGIDVAEPAAWRTYAEALGTMVAARSDADRFCLKIDERPFRVLVQPAPGAEGLAFAGWELSDATALNQAAAELEAAGRSVEVASETERLERQVRGLVRTTDPGGFGLELFWGPIHDHELFVSPTGVSGFVTGEMGLGHIVLGTTNFDESVEFYTKLLGFRITDYMGSGSHEVVFTRCNARHHSLALMGAPESELYHFMLEARTLDDVGYTLDHHQSAGIPVSRGLGRHSNDRMVSFYSRTPSGFDVEFGFGGIAVDDATWSVSEISKPSVWGHRAEQAG